MTTIIAYRYEVKDAEGLGTGRYVSLRLESDGLGLEVRAKGEANLAEILDAGVMAELEAVMAEPAEPMPRDTPEVEKWTRGER